MSNYEATKYNFDGANLTDIEGVNVGLIIPWSKDSTPDGFLDCDGSAVSQSTYAALFAIIGTTYGDPGGGNFNLPDLRDRVCVGRSPGKALASTGGANTAPATCPATITVGNTTLTTPTIASHTHSSGSYMCTGGQGYQNGSGRQPGNSSTGSTGGSGGHNHPTGNVGNISGTADILQPFLTLKYVIKY